jgi:hypothetical protein
VQIIKTPNTQINAAISENTIKARFAEMGSTVFPPGRPEQFAQQRRGSEMG